MWVPGRSFLWVGRKEPPPPGSPQPLEGRERSGSSEGWRGQEPTRKAIKMGELARPPKEREGLWSGCGQPGSRIVSGLETGSSGSAEPGTTWSPLGGRQGDPLTGCVGHCPRFHRVLHSRACRAWMCGGPGEGGCCRRPGRLSAAVSDGLRVTWRPPAGSAAAHGAGGGQGRVRWVSSADTDSSRTSHSQLTRTKPSHT